MVEKKEYDSKIENYGQRLAVIRTTVRNGGSRNGIEELIMQMIQDCPEAHLNRRDKKTNGQQGGENNGS